MIMERKLDARTADETYRAELTARRQEAGALVTALRVLTRDLEAVLLRQSYDVPVEAMALTQRLRAMADQYERRWAA